MTRKKDKRNLSFLKDLNFSIKVRRGVRDQLLIQVCNGETVKLYDEGVFRTDKGVFGVLLQVPIIFILLKNRFSEGENRLDFFLVIKGDVIRVPSDVIGVISEEREDVVDSLNLRLFQEKGNLMRGLKGVLVLIVTVSYESIVKECKFFKKVECVT